MELTHIKRKVVVYAELPKLYEYKLGYFHAKYIFIKNEVKNHKKYFGKFWCSFISRQQGKSWQENSK